MRRQSLCGENPAARAWRGDCVDQNGMATENTRARATRARNPDVVVLNRVHADGLRDTLITRPWNARHTFGLLTVASGVAHVPQHSLHSKDYRTESVQ